MTIKDCKLRGGRGVVRMYIWVRMSQGSLAGDLGRLGGACLECSPAQCSFLSMGVVAVVFWGAAVIYYEKMSSWLAVSCMGFSLDLRLL